MLFHKNNCAGQPMKKWFLSMRQTSNGHPKLTTPVVIWQILKGTIIDIHARFVPFKIVLWTLPSTWLMQTVRRVFNSETLAEYRPAVLTRSRADTLQYRPKRPCHCNHPGRLTDGSDHLIHESNSRPQHMTTDRLD